MSSRHHFPYPKFPLPPGKLWQKMLGIDPGAFHMPGLCSQVLFVV